jgi:heme oxygenase (biliverdin-producing, ferredoxin)
MVVALAARLREETRALHTQVERSPFVAELLGGRLTKPAYALMLRNLEPIYFELEAGLLRHAANASIRPLFHPPLFRLRALHCDLERLHGQRWRDELKLLNGTTAYAARLRYLTECKPELLAAHAYVRYLGDLSGGQRLAGIVARSLGLPVNSGDNWGTDFYNFGGPDEVLRLSQAFRSGLAMLSADGVVAEARLAFEMHGQLFEELANFCDLPATAVKAFD